MLIHLGLVLSQGLMRFLVYCVVQIESRSLELIGLGVPICRNQENINGETKAQKHFP